MGSSQEITKLLKDWKGGSREATRDLFSLVYPELKKIAAAYMYSERPGHTLQPTALIHEAYLKLADQRADWASRVHFYGVAAQLMRRILVDHSRSKQAAKRGGEGQRVGVEFAWDVADMVRNP